ncbi:MAG: hypothetical protein R3Y56_03405 [Akkermansia sp.]
MKIKTPSLFKALALLAVAPATIQAEEVSVQWPSEWTNAPSEVWNCTSTTGYIAYSNPSAYYTNEDGEKSIYAQYNVGTGSFVFPTELYRGSDISIDGDIWLIMADGTLGNVASAKTEGNISDNHELISYDNITTVGGDSNFYYTGTVSTALVMGGGLVIAGPNNLNASGESTVQIEFKNNVAGTARVYVDEQATVDSIVGGGYIISSTVVNATYGGSYTGTVVTEATVGASEITIADGSVTGNLFGGGYVSRITNTNTEGQQLTITTNANVLGDTNISISGGTVGNGSSVIVGGGYLGATALDAEARVLGNTEIHISGGTVNSNIYGGGSDSYNIGNADVEGSSTIYLSGGTINGHVTASGLNYATTHGDASIILTGQTTVNGNFYGETATSNVVGTSSLIIGTEQASYNQEIQNIANFDVVQVAAGSSVDIVGSVEDVQHITIDGTLTLNTYTDIASISISESGILKVTASGSTIFDNADLNWNNQGTLNISASQNAKVGYTYTIFSADIDFKGNISSADGTISGNTFTVGSADSYSTVIIDESANVIANKGDTIAISTAEDPSTSAIVMSFDVESPIELISVNTVTDQEQDNFADIVLETVGADSLLSSTAYDFNLDQQLGISDSVLISFYIGDDQYNTSQFTIYHKSGDDGSLWEEIQASDLNYLDGYLSFTVSGFSSYGYAISTNAVPEPCTTTLSILALAGLLARRRRQG